MQEEQNGDKAQFGSKSDADNVCKNDDAFDKEAITRRFLCRGAAVPLVETKMV